MITISMSPNTESDDIWLSIRTMLQPWTWNNGSATKKVEAWFATTYHTEHVFSYNSGRSALFELLRAFGIGAGDEVIVQAFTCVAVPNSVLWTGATAVYADTDSSFNIDFKDLKKKITKKTKAVIVQHTFGIPADLEALRKITQEHNLLLIEDCAHALGASYKGKLLGTWGDGAIFSFGRDKVVSSVFGGMAILPKKHQDTAARLAQQHSTLGDSRSFWIFQQLFHPIAFAVILPLYTFGIGKGLLVLLQKLQMLSFPVYPEEKKGQQPADFPKRYANGLAVLLLLQLQKLERYRNNRAAIVSFYSDALKKASSDSERSLLRFPVLVDHPQQIITNAKKQGIYLGNWYHNGIDPQGVAMNAVGFLPLSCPNAMSQAEHILNLPTRITKAEAKRIVALL